MRAVFETPSSMDGFAKHLFRRWLMYGIGTIFSMALLSVLSSMVLELTARVSLALWGSKIVNSILGNSNEGLTNMAMQQGGISLLLAVLIVSVPPMAAIFFQGTLGNSLTYSAFGAGAGNSIGPSGQSPGSWAPEERLESGPLVAHQRLLPPRDQLTLTHHASPALHRLPPPTRCGIKSPSSEGNYA